MIEISKALFIGNDSDCQNSNEMYTIHACKNKCHATAVGYTGNLDKSHPSYLVHEDQYDLYLNIVDMKFPLSPAFGNPLFSAAFKFISRAKDADILIHCNMGKSRSPSIALAHLARKGEINPISFLHAKADFIKLYPGYQPGVGVGHYLENNWDTVMNL